MHINDYEQIESRLYLGLQHESSGYTVIIDRRNRKDPVRFEVRGPLSDEVISLVTGRDFSNYSSKSQTAVSDANKRVMEIGTGLGGLLTLPILGNPNEDLRPIIVDPANYGIMDTMLRDLIKYSGKNATNNELERASELIRRIEIIRNPKKILLLNCELNEAVKKNPSLREKVDVVINSTIGSYYWRSGISSETRLPPEKIRAEVERLRGEIRTSSRHFLKSDGKYIVDDNGNERIIDDDLTKRLDRKKDSEKDDIFMKLVFGQ